MDQMYLKFARDFEMQYVSQDEYEDRTIDDTLDLGWKLLSRFPTGELKRIRQEWIDKYLPKFKKSEDMEAEKIGEAGAKKTGEAGAEKEEAA